MKRLSRFFNRTLLKQNKDMAFEQITKNTNPNLQFYKKSWKTTLSIYDDIKLNQFPKVAVVGPCSYLMIQQLFQRKAPEELVICDQSENSLNFTMKCLKDNGIIKMLQLNDVKIKTNVLQDEWEFKQDQFNLIISCMHLHQVNNVQQVLTDILKSLKPDGCLIATTFGPDNLQELRISFILAENQRYGGISPHLSPFIALPDVGNMLHRCGYRITTLSRDKNQQQISDPLTLMNYIKFLGENSSLLGKRKGAFKDLFIAMTAIYSSTFDNQKGIIVTNDIISFIGWKYSKSQIQPAKRGSQNITFEDWVKQLQKIQGQKIRFGQISQQGYEDKQNKS